MRIDEPLARSASNLDWLTGLAGADLDRASQLVTELLSGGEGLAEFSTRLQPHRPPPRHVMPLVRCLESARIQPLRLCVEMPPRHVKTTTLLNGISWWLNAFRGDTCGYYTYSDRKAWSESRKARELTAMAGVELSDDTHSVQEWRTVEGGGLLAGGAGGGLTGYGISGLMVVDDPYKNRKEADSKLIRDERFEWFNEVAFTRDEGCSFIVAHTRWHEDDMIGRLLKQGWARLRMPAIAEEDDILGRAIGEALWSDRYHIERLRRIEKQIGGFSFASLYQQRPRPRGAKLFGPAHYYDPKTVDFTGCRVVIGADTAGSKKTSANSSAAVAAMIRQGAADKRVMYVTAGYKDQVSVPQFARDLRAFQAKNHGAEAAVEGSGIGKATYQIIKDVDPSANVVEVPAVGDKFARFQGPAAAWNDERILVPLGSDEEYPWRKQFISDITELTGVNDSEDDYGDAMSHAWERGGKEEGERPSKRTAGTRR